MKAIKLYEYKNSPERIEKILKTLNKSGGWVIFYAHDVRENFSSSGCSPKYLESIIKKCTGLELEIKSIKQAIAPFSLTR